MVLGHARIKLCNLWLRIWESRSTLLLTEMMLQVSLGPWRGIEEQVISLFVGNIIIFPILRKLLVSKDLHPVQGGLARPNTQAYGLISFGLHQPLTMRLLKYLARILPG